MSAAKIKLRKGIDKPIPLDKVQKLDYNDNTKLMRGGEAMNSPQVFHDKEDNPRSYLIYPKDLFAAVNATCSGNEAKVLLTLLGCKGDGSFSPSTQYMLEMTGIPKPNHYYAIRKKLEDKGYITVDDGGIYIQTQKILSEAKANPP